MNVTALSKLRCLGLTALLATTACGAIDAPEVEETEDPIKGGTIVQPYDLAPKSTVGLNGCSGTIIGPKHVMSASHCAGVTVGTSAYFYTGAYPNGTAIRIVRKYVPFNVDAHSPGPPDGSWDVDVGRWDQNHKFADLIVLELATPIPAGYLPAKLPARFVSNGDSSKGWQIGVGRHDDKDNPTGQMRWKATKVYSSNDNDGHFLTDSSDVDHGDSGGPYYTLDAASNRLVVHGPLSGTRWEWALHGKYTSVAFHLDRVLRAMGERRFAGDLLGSDYARLNMSDPRECAIACMQDAQCKAYTHVAAWGACFLKNAVPAPNTSATGMVSGWKDSSGACTPYNGDCGI